VIRLSVLRRIAGIVLLALHCAGSAAPLAPLLSDYTHTAWSTLQGAPAKILRIAQSADGWLWLASEYGLYRYDGVQFERVQSVYGHPLVSNGIFRVAAGRDDALWVAYYLGGVSVFRKNSVHTYTEADGLPPGTVFDIQTAPDGAVWIGTRGGAMRMAPGGARFERQDGKLGLDGKLVYRILFARDGTQWVLSESGVFFRKPDEARFTLATPTVFENAVEGPDGAVWGLRDGEHYHRLQARPGGSYDAARADVHAIGLGIDRDGALWLLNRNEVERKRAARDPASSAQRLTRAEGLSGSFPQPFFQDREGNIWIGTSQGLDRFRRNRLLKVPISEDLLYPGLIRRPDGAIWVSSFPKELYRIDPAGDVTLIARERFTASYQAADGNFWLAGDQGLRREAPDGTVTTLALPQGVHGHEPNAVIQAASGAVWISFSGNGGLFRLADGRWTRDGGLAGFAASPPFTMAMDGDGTLWMGHARNSISLVRETGARPAVRRLDAAAGLALGNVLCLFQDGAHMWAGGELGAMLYRAGRFQALRGAGGETFRGVSGIVRTPDGALWLHGIDGVYRIGAASLAAWMREPAGPVGFERFDAQHGLRGVAPQLRPFPSLRLAADGKLWIATGNSVAVADPRHLYRNPLAPPVVLRTAAAKEVLHDVEQRRTLSLPERSDSLRLSFTALSLSIPERVRFRYRLVGLDRDWQTPVERRAVSYTNLAPGSYRFELAAANEDGVWSPDPAVLAIEIRPAFVQTGWFTLLLAAAAALLLYLAYRWRVRIISRRLQERHRAQLEERSRIARSLHDTLLQSVQGVILSFNAHALRLPAGSPERGKLDGSLRLAWDLVREARDQIMGLRASAAPDDLRLALHTYGKDLAQYGGYDFALRRVGRIRLLRPQVHDELYAIGREALFNAARHAQPRQVLLELDYGPDAFTLSVRDDGRGLDPGASDAEALPDHWGVRGMHERARDLDAAFHLASAPGEGTTVTVTLAAGLAYQAAAAPAGGAWSHWWRRAKGRRRE